MSHYFKKFIFISFSFCIFFSAYTMENAKELANADSELKNAIERAIKNNDLETTKNLCKAKAPLTNIYKQYNVYHFATGQSKELVETLIAHGYIDLSETKNKQTKKRAESWKYWTPKQNGKKPDAPIEQTIWGALLAFNHTDSKDKKPRCDELSYLPKNIQNHIFSKLVSKKNFHFGLCTMLLNLKIYDNDILPILVDKHRDCIGKMLSDSNNAVALTPLQLLWNFNPNPAYITTVQSLFDGTKINEDAKVFNDAFSQNNGSSTTKILESIPKDNLCRQIAEIHYLSLPTNK